MQRTTCLTLATLTFMLFGGALVTARAADEAVSGDLKKMQGTWVRAGDEGPDLRWTVDGAKLKAEVNGQLYQCKIKLDSQATPHPTADIEVVEGPEDSSGKTAKAIYKFEGERLMFCIGIPGRADRPTEFKYEEDATFVFALKKE